ncbi:MAG: oligopeptide transporter, OPT family [Deltaproteobacteria bacterium]|nr:oligopeptide transporter, OPT family [Deltaproteobacteria bacterium]
MSDATSSAPFKPYIAPSENIREFTFKSIFLGILFGILFGASTVYLGLKIGLTVSASIPVAVLSIAIFKRISGSTILENNIVQTTASSGEAIAGGVTFTLPALIFMGFQLDYPLILILSLIGGILGVLFMIPLRRSLIVEEHHKLPYPEGTACADVLIAGEKGGKLAAYVFSGLGFSAFYKLLMNVFGFWKESPTLILKWYQGAMVSGEITPELLGVGYIIGPRIAGIMAAGGALAWLVLMPAISFFGQSTLIQIAPAVKPIADMSMMEIWSNYIRYIGGGTVVFGGLVTLFKSFPTIWKAFSKSFRDFKKTGEMESGDRLRTEQDMSLVITAAGAFITMIIISFLPFLPGSTLAHFVSAVMVVVFGFFFCTVSSRITGLVGSSSNPISGMTITTLMLTCLIFVLCGWKGPEYGAIALSVGAIICIAAAIAGTTSQDLKTGYLVGATPYKQQWSLIIGVLVCSLTVGLTMIALHKAGLAVGKGIGSSEFPAPKGQLMAIIIDGVLNQQLPWTLIFLGVFIGVFIQLCGIEALPFAVGVYLPFSISLPILVGGLVHGLVKMMGEKSDTDETSPGILYSSGLIAGGAVMGIIIAFLQGFGPDIFKTLNVGPAWHLGEGQGVWGDAIAALMFFFMAFTLFQTARKKERHG